METPRNGDEGLSSQEKHPRWVNNRSVLLFTPGHAEIGGAGWRSRVIAEGLAVMGWRVGVITRAGTLARFRFQRSEGFWVLEVPGFGRRRLGALLFMLVGSLLGALIGANARLFVGIQLSSPTLMASLCGVLWRRPFVSFSTSSGALSEARDAVSGSFLRRRLIARAAFLVGQTQAAAEELSNLVPRERIRVIGNPVPKVVPPPLTGNRNVMFSGRLSEEKDLPLLLDAWRSISVNGNLGMLYLAGTGGSYRSVEYKLRDMVDKSEELRRTVKFTGWLDDLSSLFANCDVYVFPSRSEGMSNSLLEACAHLRLVVASNIPSNVEILGADYPLLFEVGDVESLINSLLSAWDDDDVRSRALESIRSNLTRFDAERILGQIDRMLTEAVTAGSRSGT